MALASGRTPGHSDASTVGGPPPGRWHQRREPERPTWLCRDRLSLSFACWAPLNRGGLNSTPIHGTLVPVEEPSTASEPDFADMFNLGQRADVCWLACLVQACHLQSAIQRHLTQFQVTRLCWIGMRSQPARGQLRLNPDGGAYPFRVHPTDAPAFARLIPSVSMRCRRVV